MDLGELLRNTWSLLIYMLPAMTANGAPVVASKFFGQGTPIDGGRYWKDGRRLLGDGKTWEGFLAGTLTGILTGLILGLFLGDIVERVVLGLLAGLGAMMGDIVGSFIKRRLGLERGARAPLLDQLDFYVGALLFLYLGGLRFDWAAVLLLAVIVVILHMCTNYLAYIIGIKKVPY